MKIGKAGEKPVIDFYQIKNMPNIFSFFIF